jgi:hypothetical protein
MMQQTNNQRKKQIKIANFVIENFKLENQADKLTDSQTLIPKVIINQLVSNLLEAIFVTSAALDSCVESYSQHQKFILLCGAYL